MISSCCTFRLKRRSALSIDSPSWTFTSAKLDHTPFAAAIPPSEPRGVRWNVLGYHRKHAHSKAESSAAVKPASFPASYSSTYTYRTVVRVLVIGGGGREHALAWK